MTLRVPSGRLNVLYGIHALDEAQSFNNSVTGGLVWFKKLESIKQNYKLTKSFNQFIIVYTDMKIFCCFLDHCFIVKRTTKASNSPRLNGFDISSNLT